MSKPDSQLAGKRYGPNDPVDCGKYGTGPASEIICLGQSGRRMSRLSYCKMVGQLKPFDPNYAANPDGAVPGRTLTQILQSRLNVRADFVPYIKRLCKKYGVNPQNSTVADILVEVWIEAAIKRSPVFFMEMLNRVEGKVPERLAGHDGGPISQDERRAIVKRNLGIDFPAHNGNGESE